MVVQWEEATASSLGNVYKKRSHEQNSDVEERNVGMEQGGLIMVVEAEIKELLVREGVT